MPRIDTGGKSSANMGDGDIAVCYTKNLRDHKRVEASGGKADGKIETVSVLRRENKAGRR